jgi:hypothetical protein
MAQAALEDRLAQLVPVGAVRQAERRVQLDCNCRRAESVGERSGQALEGGRRVISQFELVADLRERAHRVAMTVEQPIDASADAGTKRHGEQCDYESATDRSERRSYGQVSEQEDGEEHDQARAGYARDDERAAEYQVDSIMR